jgi:YhcH/YjgK/YiaL family protein
MVLDNLNNASTYYDLHPRFQEAFEYLNSNNLEELSDGMITLSEDLRVIVNTSEALSKKESLEFFECHDQHIDIQVCVKGPETFAWKSRQNCISPKSEYNTEKDVRFYNDEPDTYYELKSGQFTILFPNDMHASMMGVGTIKKIIVKVKI